MNHRFLTAIVLSIVLVGAAHADSAADKAERVLLAEFREHYLSLVVERLEPLDEPAWEIEAKAEALLKAYVDCVISAAKVAEHAAAKEYVHLVAAGYSPKKIRKYYSYLSESDRQAVIGSLERPIKSCVGGVHNELGVLWFDNGHVVSW